MKSGKKNPQYFKSSGLEIFSQLFFVCLNLKFKMFQKEMAQVFSFGFAIQIQFMSLKRKLYKP